MGRGEYYKQKYGGGRSRGQGRGRGRGPEGYTQPAEEKVLEERHLDISDSGLGAYQSNSAEIVGDENALYHTLSQIDNKGYKAYNDIRGRWKMSQDVYVLCVDHIQSDPYAPPSHFRIQMPVDVANFPRELFHTKIRRIALADYLARSFSQAITSAGADIRSGNSSWGGEKGGDMQIDAGDQHVLERTSVIIDEQGNVESRFTVALPARGRSVLGKWASTILIQNLPRYAVAGLTYGRQDKSRLKRHVEVVEDTDHLRQEIARQGYVAFVGNGSVLPRLSGASDKPMKGDEVIQFQSPTSMEIAVQLPNAGEVRGMAIGKGVTVLVGGGFHGKSTVLKALEAGVTNKIPGDGREHVVCLPSAFKIRAEDGRRVEGVNISPFISNLPFGRTTDDFRTDDASGSTSQAANIVEAMEMGSKLLLIDEDTTATNFMIRDARMQALVAPDKEPITPLVAKIRPLAALGVSCILVIGGSGDYFEVADRVIAMDCFQAKDVTQQAHAIARNSASPRPKLHSEFGHLTARIPVSGVPSPGIKVKSRETDGISLGDQEVDLSYVEQIFDKSQTRGIAEALLRTGKKLQQTKSGNKSLAEILADLEHDLDLKGLDHLSPDRLLGNLARPRMLEVGAALNRLRSLKVKQR